MNWINIDTAKPDNNAPFLGFSDIWIDESNIDGIRTCAYFDFSDNDKDSEVASIFWCNECCTFHVEHVNILEIEKWQNLPNSPKAAELLESIKS
jgi:hypothetical protein